MSTTSQQIVQKLQADPSARIGGLISDEAGPFLERLLGRSDPGKREAIIAHLTEIYADVATMAKTMRGRVVALNMDAASHRSVALSAIAELRDLAELLDELDMTVAAQQTRTKIAEFEHRIDLETVTAPNPRPERP